MALIIVTYSRHPQKPEQGTTVKASRQKGPSETGNLIVAMKISSAGAREARIWKCRADGQPGFLESLSFCLLSDSSAERGFGEFMEGQVLSAFLEISLTDVWTDVLLTPQKSYKWSNLFLCTICSQGHASRTLPSASSSHVRLTVSVFATGLWVLGEGHDFKAIVF